MSELSGDSPDGVPWEKAVAPDCRKSGDVAHCGIFISAGSEIAAVERKLQVISEAAGRLGEQVEALCPGLPWRDIRGIGNWLRQQTNQIQQKILVSRGRRVMLDSSTDLWQLSFRLRTCTSRRRCSTERWIETNGCKLGGCDGNNLHASKVL
jgi:uncharacterized protein with HEPN domain